MNIEFKPFSRHDWMSFGGAEQFVLEIPVEAKDGSFTGSFKVATDPVIGYGTDPAGNEFTVVCDANAFEVHWNLARENHRAIVLNHPILLTAQREGLLLAQRTPLPWESGHICWQTLI